MYKETLRKALILHTYVSIHTGKTKSKKIMFRSLPVKVWRELGPAEPEWDFKRNEYKIVNLTAAEIKERSVESIQKETKKEKLDKEVRECSPLLV